MDAGNVYVELVRGGLTHRGNIVPLAAARVEPGERESYCSMFVHGSALVAWVASTGSVSGFKGPHSAGAFIVDVDSDSDLEHARTDAVKIVQMLEEIYDVPRAFVRIAFSGAKGFHLIVPMAAIADDYLRPNFAQIFHGMAAEIFAGFDTVDLSIYEPKRILRMMNTVNAKTGLHKIPLTFDELSSDMDAIREMAKAPRKRADAMPLSEISRCEGIAALFEKHAGHVTSGDKVAAQAPAVSADDDIAKIMRGVSSGGRNEALVRLTGLMIRKGMPEHLTAEMMRTWNTANTPPLEDDELSETVAKQYRMYADHGGVDESTPEIINMRQAGENYMRYVKRMREARLHTGLPPIDEKLRAVAPGETICILGKTSVGKSALMQNIGRNYAMSSGAPVIMFSLEMPETSVYERSLQLEYGKYGRECEHVFDTDDRQAAQWIEEMSVAMSNFYIVVKAMDVQRIISYVRYAEANLYHQRTGLVLIDYLGLVKGKGKSIYEEVSRVARDMKDAAKELDVPICYLSQVNKLYKIDQELELGAARDSGAIDEAADYILGIWRMSEAMQTDRENMRCRIGILKNRKGGLATFDATMHKQTLNFYVEPEYQQPQAAPPPSVLF